MISGPERLGASARPFAPRPAFARLLGLASPLWPALLVAALLLVYLVHTQTVVYGYDPLGYLLAGTQLAGGQGLSFVDPLSLQAGPYFAPYAFRIFQPGNPYPAFNFPPGYPAILALAALLWPDPRAVFFVTPLLAAAGLAVTWWTGRRLFGPIPGLAAAALLGLSPLYLQFATDLWSDLPAAVCGWLGIAFYLSAEGRHDGTAERGGLRGGRVVKAALAGLLLAYGAWIRYSMAVFAAPVAAYVAATALRRPRGQRARAALGFLIALALGLGALLVYNRLFYGGFFETGYSARQGWYPWPAFSLGYALGPSPVGGYSLGASLRTFWEALGPAAILGLLAFGVSEKQPAAAGGPARIAAPGGTIPAVALIAAPAAAVWLLYAGYAFQPAGINARFLLPALPAFCLGAGQAAAWAGVRCARWASAREGLRPAAGMLPVALLVGVALASFGPAITAVEARAQATQTQIAGVQRFTAALEPGAVVMAHAYHDLIGYYGPRSVLNFERMVPVDVGAGRYRTEVFEPCLTQTIARLRAAGVPVYYVDDTHPSAWDALAVLRRNFGMEPVQAAELPTYRVLGPLAADRVPEGEACRP